VAVTAKRQTLGSARIREALTGYAFIAVPMGLFLVFFIYPLLYSLYISRYDWGVFGKIDFVGWGNYRSLFHDQIFWRAVKNTAMFAVAVVALEVTLGLVLAVVVNQTLRFRTFYRAGFYFPSIASSAAITAIFIYILSADGLLNSFLGLFGYHTSRPWFYDSSTALWSIVGLNGWATSGTIMLFYRAALQAIPVDVYEAARLDGATAWQTFRRITVPLMRPTVALVLTLMVTGSLLAFDQFWILTRGGPDNSTTSLVMVIYRKAFIELDLGSAAAISVVLLGVLVVFNVVQLGMLRRRG
jgi:multiple sugar transport system permease protein